MTFSFTFGSLALPYAQHVNNHILLLAVAAGSTAETAVQRSTAVSAVRLGTLTGFAYTIDLGAGPLLLAAVGGWVLWQRRGALTFAICALPWLIAHHTFNYAIAGTIWPANTNPEYFQWHGSPFNSETMTGSWHHSSQGHAAVYALELLFGKKGFLLFSLPLVQAVAGSYWLFRYRYAERPTVIALGLWALGTWLLYSTTSTNHSGNCLSIRWFVPLLVPGYVALMIMVRDYPASRQPLIVLVVGGLLLSVESVVRGPWWPRVPLLLWPVVGLSLTVWLVTWLQHLRRYRRIASATKPTTTTIHRGPSPAETTE